MYEETIAIDIDRLRNDMREECLGAYFGGGFGAASIELDELEKASGKELVELEKTKRINLLDYRI